jgi:CheY-like chemotaxis protein
MRLPKNPAGGIDVLIAEDDAVTRMTLRQLLEGEGYVCAEAEDGREALEIARQSPPRVVLLDLMMPALDGVSVARQLQADPRTRSSRIHFVTGRSDRAARAAARRAGAEVFLTKPLDFDGITDLVRVALCAAPDAPQAVVS